MQKTRSKRFFHLGLVGWMCTTGLVTASAVYAYYMFKKISTGEASQKDIDGVEKKQYFDENGKKIGKFQYLKQQLDSQLVLQIYGQNKSRFGRKQQVKLDPNQNLKGKYVKHWQSPNNNQTQTQPQTSNHTNPQKHQYI